jgi:hypothetical protein
MLLEQDQLINDHGTQGEQRRPLQAFNGHVHPSL